MNMAITDRFSLSPAPFTQGLGQWSREDGTFGTETYASYSSAVVVPSDPDFGSCLQLTKNQGGTQRLRFTGQTALATGCYYKVSARIKAVSGSRPSVQIAGSVFDASDDALTGVQLAGAAVTLQTYGNVIEVSAIVGQGSRPGVDMAWGMDAEYAHIGLDLTGPVGGVIRIDDLRIEDVTPLFFSQTFDVLDVRDFGAIGDGVADDADAIEAADAAAQGRTVLVTDGVFRMGRDVTINSKIRFEGQITQLPEHRFVLRRSFDLPTYADAFGDEVVGFKKGFQALLNGADHEVFDLCGRQVQLTEPLDMAALVPNRARFEVRRVIANGMFEARDSTAWADDVVTASASYDPNDPYKLRNVVNAASIKVGSLVSGNGVGREVYVASVNPSANTLTLCQPLFGAAASQSYTFTRFKYMLDFGGFEKLSKMVLNNIQLQCSGRASGIMLAPDGVVFEVLDCLINKPKSRGITSADRGCQGMIVDRCQFLSNEQSLQVEDRVTTALNVNSNDPKLRNNRVVLFEHFAVLSGAGNLVTGNHWFHGDAGSSGIRKAGLIFTQPNCMSAVTGNYIDNNYIEMTNEHEAFPDFANQFSFGGLTISGNFFISLNSRSDFSWLVVAPYGAGHFIQGLSVQGNVFKAVNGNVERADRVDTSRADLAKGRYRNIVFDGNTFNNVGTVTINPVVINHDQNTDAATWNVSASGRLPFDGWARTVQAVQLVEQTKSGSTDVFIQPWAQVEQGADKSEVRLKWGQSTRGRANVTMRCDTPV